MPPVSTYTEEVAERICERVGEGEPLRQVCRDEGFPSWRTVYRWIEEQPEFASRFAHARARGFDAIAEDCLDIADETAHDSVATEQGERPNTEWISRSKLRVETRLKLLAKWDPKRYGEKLALGGADDLPPIKTVSDEQLAARIKALTDRLNAAEPG